PPPWRLLPRWPLSQPHAPTHPSHGLSPLWRAAAPVLPGRVSGDPVVPPESAPRCAAAPRSRRRAPPAVSHLPVALPGATEVLPGASPAHSSPLCAYRAPLAATSAGQSIAAVSGRVP